jgi:hypothetical protein
MRLALLTVLAAVVLAAPARAQNTPAPTVVTFDAAPPQGLLDSPEACTGAIVASGGRDGGPFWRIPCGNPQVRFRLPQTANTVAFFVRAPQGGSDLFVSACDRTFCDGNPDVDSASVRPAPTGWTAIVLTDDTGQARIDNVLVQVPSRSRRSTSPTRRSVPALRSRSRSTRRSGDGSPASSMPTPRSTVQAPSRR